MIIIINSCDYFIFLSYVYSKIRFFGIAQVIIIGAINIMI